MEHKPPEASFHKRKAEALARRLPELKEIFLKRKSTVGPSVLGPDPLPKELRSWRKFYASCMASGAKEDERKSQWVTVNFVGLDS